MTITFPNRIHSMNKDRFPIRHQSKAIMAATLGAILFSFHALPLFPGLSAQDAEQTAKDSMAWKYLFNGVDLNGWVNINGAADTWSVREGMIHCTGKPICALRTTEQYENFILELEWRHLRSGGNAGVFLWAAPEPATGQPFLRAIEVQVLDHGYGKSDWFTTHGDVFPIHGSTMKPFEPSRGMRSFPSEERSKGSPEWNHYRIECRNGTLKLSVNGAEVSGGSECNWRKGYIALESEGSPVDFRNIRVHQLPDSGTIESTMAAPLPGGYAHLYNGVNLEGWVPASHPSFTPSDWRLIAGPHKDGEKRPLWSRYQGESSFEMFLDIRVPEDADLTKSSYGSLCFFNDPTPAVSFGKGDGHFSLLEQFIAPGKWTRVHITRSGSRMTVSSLGKSLTVPAADPGEFQPGPESHLVGVIPSDSESAEFANFFIRPLRKP